MVTWCEYISGFAKKKMPPTYWPRLERTWWTRIRSEDQVNWCNLNIWIRCSYLDTHSSNLQVISSLSSWNYSDSELRKYVKQRTTGDVALKTSEMTISGGPMSALASDPQRSPWVSMGIQGYLWISMDFHGYLWIPVHIHGNLWTSMEIHGYPDIKIWIRTMQ